MKHCGIVFKRANGYLSHMRAHKQKRCHKGHLFDAKAKRGERVCSTCRQKSQIKYSRKNAKKRAEYNRLWRKSRKRKK